MRKIFRFIIPLFLLIFFSCDLKSPVEGVKIILNTDGAQTTVSLSFIDRATNDLIGFSDNKKVSATIEGRSKGEVVDLVLLNQTSFSSDKGFLSFGFRNEASFPLDITVIARTSEYLTTSISITVNETGAHAYDVYMVNISNPPAGVTIVKNFSGAADGSGTLVNDLNVQTPPDISGGTNAFAELNISQGSVIKTKDGQPLSGNLTTVLAYFNNRSEASLSSFPGGLNPEALINGSLQNVSFYTGGFASIEITDGAGNIASNISGNSNLTIQIPNHTFNTDAGRIVQDGDDIPVWSYNITSGEWKLEGPGDVVQAGNNNFNVTYALNHLSYYNLSWFTTSNCSSGSTVLLQTSECDGAPLKVVAYRVINGEEYYMRTFHIPSGQNSITFTNPPSGPARIKAYYNQTQLVGVMDIADLCAAGQIIFPINTGSALHTVNANVRGYCPNNPNIEIRPTVPLWYRTSGTNNSWSLLGNMVNGQLTLRCFPFGIYDVAGYFDGEFVIEQNININMENLVIDYEMPPSSCN